MKYHRLLFAPEGDPGSAGGGGPAVADPAPADPAPSPSTPLINDDLTFSEGWQDRLGDDAKGLTFKSLKDMAKSVREGTATISRLNQEKSELAKKLEGAGQTPPVIPADVSGYKASLKLPEALPDGINIPDDVLDAASDFAIRNGIPPEVTAKFVEFQIEQAGKELESHKTEAFSLVEAAKAKIKSEVGPQNYETTIADAKAAHDVLGLTIDPDTLVQNPTLVMSLARLHKVVSPGNLKAAGFSPEVQSAESKLTQAKDILTNEANPMHKAFYDNAHPMHREAVATHARLIAESQQRG